MMMEKNHSTPLNVVVNNLGDKPFLTAKNFDTDGRYIRKESEFRNFVSEDSLQYPVESGRYHLYINLACPWSNAAWAIVELKGL